LRLSADEHSARRRGQFLGQLAGEPLVGFDRCDASSPEFEHQFLTLVSAQAPAAEIEKRYAVRQLVAGDLGGGLRDEDLPRLCERSEPCGAIDRRAEVVGVTLCASPV
jgi:hypothetical protein